MKIKPNYTLTLAFGWTFAPARSKHSATFENPKAHAQSKGVHPFKLLVWIWEPFLINLQRKGNR